jgi:hypothetical protein
VVVHGETHDIVDLSRPTTVAVWRSGDVARLGFPAASSLQQSGSGLEVRVWRSVV